MRTIVVGDIHGGLRALIQLLNKLEVKEDDKLIFLGDYVDGWSESAQVIQFLIKLSENIKCVFIKGNHDAWCEEWLENGDVNPTWYIHGGKETLESYEAISKDNRLKHLQFFKDMPMYYLDKSNRLFIHAGFTSMHGVKKEVFKKTFYFDRTLWETAITMDKNIEKESPLYPNRLKLYNEIYIGHTPTTRYNFLLPMQAVNIWNIDTGAAFKGKLSAIDVDTKTIFQSDFLPFLYPDEIGRNKN